MAIILGVDPGSRKTGYGVINQSGNQLRFLAGGTIHVADLVFPERLKRIHLDISAVIAEFQPETLVIEQVFLAKNASSALKLGHARGTVMAACALAGLDVVEYSARQIKLAVVGTGGADKAQVQHMVKVLLGLSQSPQEDAADALAAAICHAHTRPRQQLLYATDARQALTGRQR